MLLESWKESAETFYMSCREPLFHPLQQLARLLHRVPKWGQERVGIKPGSIVRRMSAYVPRGGAAEKRASAYGNARNVTGSDNGEISSTAASSAYAVPTFSASLVTESFRLASANLNFSFG